MPEVSVIIPVYNGIEYLPRCLDSVLQDRGVSTEVILVDDGSDDGSGALCDEYARRDCRIRVLHQENRGISAARNAGLRASTGAYIAYVDADDAVSPGFFSALYRRAVSSGADMTICGTSGREEEPGPVLYRHTYPPTDSMTPQEFLSALLNGKMSYGAWSRLYTRELALKVPFPEGRVYEEIATVFGFAANSERIALEPQAVYTYYKKHPSSITAGLKGSRRILLDLYRSMREFAESTAERYPALRPELDDYLVRRMPALWKRLAPLEPDGEITEYMRWAREILRTRRGRLCILSRRRRLLAYGIITAPRTAAWLLRKRAERTK